MVFNAVLWITQKLMSCHMLNCPGAMCWMTKPMALWQSKIHHFKGATYTIPPKSNTVNPWECDFHVYKERHFVECFFNKLKHFRRVATRYDKLAASFTAFVYIAAILFCPNNFNDMRTCPHRNKCADFRGKIVADEAKIRWNPCGFQEFLTMSGAIFAEKTHTYSYVVRLLYVFQYPTDQIKLISSSDRYITRKHSTKPIRMRYPFQFGMFPIQTA